MLVVDRCWRCWNGLMLFNVGIGIEMLKVVHACC